MNPGASRRSRAEQQAETRRALLDAAAHEFAANGFGDTSIEQISANAGFTRGAFYAHFPDKASIFVALVEERMKRSAADLHAIFESSETPTAAFDAFQDRYDAGSPGHIDWALLDAEFWLYAQRHEKARRLLAERQASLRADLAALIDAQFERLGLDLPLPAHELAAAAMALDEGLLHQRRTDTAAVPDDLLMRLLQMLVVSAGPTRGTAPSIRPGDGGS